MWHYYIYNYFVGMAFDSMLFNSMTKSMQLAREVMQQGVLDPKTNDDGIQCMGMQDLANTIDKGQWLSPLFT